MFFWRWFTAVTGPDYYRLQAIRNEVRVKSSYNFGLVWYRPLHILLYRTLKKIWSSKIPLWVIIAHYILHTSLPFAFLWQQNPSVSYNTGIEDQAFGHRPLIFFVADIISHSSKPYSCTPWQYANNVPGLPLYCHTWTICVRGTRLLLELLSNSTSL